MPFVNNQERAQSKDLAGRGRSYRLLSSIDGPTKMLILLNVLTPSGGRGPYHYHTDQDTVYFVLDGVGHVIIDGEAFALRKGDCIWIPAGAKHDVSNVGDTELRMVEVKAPADGDHHGVEPEIAGP